MNFLNQPLMRWTALTLALITILGMAWFAITLKPSSMEVFRRVNPPPFLAAIVPGDTPIPTRNPLAIYNYYLPKIQITDITRMRPYLDTSFWNTPIGDTPSYDPHSAEMVATIGLDSEGRIYSTPDEYSYTVYFVDQTTPRWDIPCVSYKCTIVTPEETIRTDMLPDVPLPPGAKPAGGSDAAMLVIDKSTLKEYNLRGVQRTKDGWRVKNGSVYNILWDGTPAQYGSRGSGIPFYAGLVRPWEIRQGRIDHVITFSYTFPARDRCVFPATKTDGDSVMTYAIPEGAQLQLDPSLTEQDFDDMGLERAGKIIARALQKYGMVLVNAAGRTKIYVENLADNPFATEQWSDPDLNLTAKSIANIPYTAFRVIALPEAYWDPHPDSPTHGNCFAYP